MMRASALLMLLVPVPTLAAPEPADRDSRLAMAQYGACIAKGAQELARRAVLEQWESADFRNHDLLRIDQCWKRGTIRFRMEYMRAAIANALVVAGTGVGPARIAEAPPLAYTMPDPVRTVDEKGRPLSPKSIERNQNAVTSKLHGIAIAQFGECVARANPAAVPALAATEVASDAEMAALKEFAGVLPGCVPKGVQLELDRSSLRSAITVAYYRLAMAARETPAGGVAAK